MTGSRSDCDGRYAYEAFWDTVGSGTAGYLQWTQLKPEVQKNWALFVEKVNAGTGENHV